MLTCNDSDQVEYVAIVAFPGSTVKLAAGIIIGEKVLASNFSTSTVLSMTLCSS
jgi:hypothetical protein